MQPCCNEVCNLSVNNGWVYMERHVPPTRRRKFRPHCPDLRDLAKRCLELSEMDVVDGAQQGKAGLHIGQSI